VLGVGMLALILVVSLSGWLGQEMPSESSASDDALKIGQPALDFECMTLAGEKVRLSDYQGQPVLINFWATWCPPCVAEMPALQRVYAQNASGLVVLAVNAGDTAAQAQAFAENNALTFPVLMDDTGEAQRQYRVMALPMSIFIDAEGMIQAIVTGEMTDMILKVNLRKIGYQP